MWKLLRSISAGEYAYIARNSLVALLDRGSGTEANTELFFYQLK